MEDVQDFTQATEAAVERKTETPPPDQQGTETPPSETAAPEIDYKAEYERLRDDNARLEQRVRSAEGRLRNAVTVENVEQIQTEIRGLKREMRRNQIESADLDEEQRRTRLQELSQEEQEERDRSQLVQYAERLAGRINSRLSRAGIETDHPKVQEALTKWRQAKSRDDFDDVYDFLDEFIDQEMTARTRKEAEDSRRKAEEERQRQNREDGTLALGATGGQPAGAEKRAWTREELAAMTPEEYAKARPYILGQ